MSAYLLRLEAVNLGGFLDDTGQLSVVRGGGLLLLHAVDRVRQRFAPGLKPVTTGASTGLFELAAADDAAAARTRDEVQGFLRSDEQLRHATFVVDVAPAGDFGPSREELLALNRWRQWRQPTVAVPSQPPDEANRGPCRLDGVRPAGPHDVPRGSDPPQAASVAVHLRWRYGVDQKQRFYEEHAGVEARFTQDFDELAKDPARGNLDGKMAVIYADGNRFGDVQHRLCRDAGAARRFDLYLKGQRRAWLTALLGRAQADGSGFHTSDGKLRVETLLWGGDELVVVVPAWTGWVTLASFFEHAAGWEFEGERLTHAAGLVFCHHNAPIRRVKALAKDLADRAKAKSRTHNLFAYQVLESFDHVGRDLKTFLASRWSRPDELIVSGEAMRGIGDQVRTLVAGEFPRSKLHAIARALVPHGGDDEVKRRRAEAWIHAALEKRPQLKPPVEALRARFGGEHDSAVSWFHLTELWDYLEGAC